MKKHTTINISEEEALEFLRERLTHLREKTDFFDTLFRSLGGYAIIAADFDGNIQVYNEEVITFYGYKHEDIIGGKMNIDAFFPGDFIETEKLQQIIKNTMACGTHSFEGENVRKDGSRFPVQIVLTVVKSNDGKIIGFVEIVQDLTERRQWEREIEKLNEDLEHRVIERTEQLDAANKTLTNEIVERKRAEESVKKSEKWVRAISESANDAIICIDDTGNVNFWNKKAEQMFGYSTDEAMGKPVCTLIIPERYRKKHTEGLKTFSRTGTGRVVGKPIELSSLRKDGDEFPIELSISAMKVNEKWHAIGIIRDITERKRSEERISMQLQRLNTLHDIDKVIASTLDRHVSLDMFLQKALTQLQVDAADILFFDPQTQELEYIAASGFQKFTNVHRHIRLGEGVAGRIAAERRMRCIQNLNEAREEWVRKELITDEFFTAYCGIPLVAKGQLKGVFEVFHHVTFSDDTEWMNYIETLAGQAAIAIDNITLFESLQRSNTEIVQAYDDTIEGWSRALDMRDKETEGHCRRVTDMTLMVARAMNIPKEHLIHIRRGALLHDIGKVGIPDSILQKPGLLTEEEWVIMRKHPIYAYELLSPVAYLRPAMDIPYCHHEKWDGTGYPRGLKDEQIPIAARIFAVVDVWEALRSVRVYKPAWPEEKVREHIRSLAGTHFDQKVVDVFLKMK